MFETLKSWWGGEQAAMKQSQGHPAAGVIGWFDRGDNMSGVDVTESIALTYSAVWAATRVITETVASLPCFLYRRRPDGGRERAIDDTRFGLVHDSPNELMTPYSYFETVTGHMVLWGNGYSRIIRSGGVPSALEIRLPDSVRIEAEEDDVRYKIDSLGEDIPSIDILHVAGLGHDGIKGYSVIKQAAESIGAAIAAEKYSSSFFGSGAQPAGALVHPNRLSKEHREAFRKQWNEVHQGPQNANKIAILHGGMEYKQLGMSNEDAQFLESRQFSVTEIARWFRLPPHTLADLSNATFSNIEQQALEFVKYSITPWLRRWETTLNKKLLRRGEQGTLYFEFLLDSLLRGDIESRYNAFATARQWGWMSADDIRAMENMNPLPNGIGQTYLHPLNMVPADDIPPVLSEDFQQSLKQNLETVLNSQELFAERLMETGSVVEAVRATEEALLQRLKTSHDDQRQMRKDLAELGKRVQSNGHSPDPYPGVREVREAVNQMYRDAQERLLKHETNVAKKLAKRAVDRKENFVALVDEFYDTWSANCSETYLIVLRPWCVISKEDPSELTRRVTEMHIERSKNDLLAASETDLENLLESVKAATSSWSDRLNTSWEDKK